MLPGEKSMDTPFEFGDLELCPSQTKALAWAALRFVMADSTDGSVVFTSSFLQTSIRSR